MTRYLPLLFCLSACQTADGAAGLIGPPGPQGPAGEQGPRGDKGDPAPTTKQLHLIVADTGEDLGLLINPLGVAFNERLGGPVYYQAAPTLFFADADCKGVSRISTIGPTTRDIGAPGPRGTLLRLRGAVAAFQYASMIGADGKCANGSGSHTTAREYDDTGVPAKRIVGEYEFAVELR